MRKYIVRTYNDDLSGPLNVITFKKFMDCIARKEVSNSEHYYLFNALVKNNNHVFFDEKGVLVDELDSSDYNEDAIYLSNGPEELVYKAHIFTQTNVKTMKRDTVSDMVCTATVDHVEGYGRPTHLVRVSRRLWMIANPEDFMKVFNDRGVGLACYFRPRTLLYLVGRKEKPKQKAMWT